MIAIGFWCLTIGLTVGFCCGFKVGYELPIDKEL